MNVCVQLFAVARQLAGADVLEVELPSGSTIGQLREALSAKVPALAPVLPQIVFSIGSDYASDQSVIPEGAEVACIPPVSGG